MKKPALYLIISAVVLVLGLATALFLARQNQNPNKKASSSTGSVIFHLDPPTTVIPVGQTQLINGNLKYISTSPSINSYGYQIKGSYFYSGTPALVINNSTLNLFTDPTKLDCSSVNYVRDDLVGTISFAVSCHTTDGTASFAIPNQDLKVFDFSLTANTVGSIDITFDPLLSKVLTPSGDTLLSPLSDAPYTSSIPAQPATITFIPSSSTVTADTTVTAYLNTYTSSIAGYSVIGSFPYTGSVPPVDIDPTSLSPSSAILTACFGNSITNDSTSIPHRVTLKISCGVPFGSVTGYSTNSQPVSIFTFKLKPNISGSITMVFDCTTTNCPNIVTPYSGGPSILTPISDLNYSYQTILPTVTLTPTPTPIPPTITPTASPTATPVQLASLTINASFQGQPPSVDTNIHLGTLYNFNPAVFSQANNYSYTAPPIIQPNPITAYDLLIQAPNYLDRKITGLHLVSGSNTQNISPSLKVGDFDSNNILNSADISLLLDQFIQHASVNVTTDASNAKFDVTHDGHITIEDLALVLSNFTTSTSIPGD